MITLIVIAILFAFFVLISYIAIRYLDNVNNEEPLYHGEDYDDEY